MSESVVVNFVANALWQLHRFLQLCLRHRGKLVELLLSRSSQSAKAGYLTARQSCADEESEEDVEGDGGEIHQKRERGQSRVEGIKKVDGPEMS